MPGKSGDRVLYLSVPESLRVKIEETAHENEDDFSINPDIPLPVEISGDDKKVNLEELSWEMIISGMLIVIASGEVNEDWISYYRRFVLAVRPSILGEFTEAAILKARNSDFDLALEILDSLLGLFPSLPSVMLNRALVIEQYAVWLEQKGKPETPEAYAAAEAAYSEILSQYPDFPGALFNAGFFHLGRKNFREAREYFELYLEDPEDDLKKEKAETIIKDINENGLDDESFSEAYNYINSGNEEAGMQCIHGFIEDHPAVWNGWFVLGWALRRLCRWKDGAAAFEKAIELGGTGSDTRNELAICLMELGDLQGARHQLESALFDDPENIKIISNLGMLALRNGKTEEAAAFFRTVLEIDPEDPIAKKYFEKN